MAFVNIQVQGKEVTCQFSILALRKYCDEHDLSLTEFHNHLAMKAPFSYTDMAYFAYCTFCDLNGKDRELGRDAFTSFVEQMSDKEASQISEAILEIKFMGKSFKDRADEKKKTS